MSSKKKTKKEFNLKEFIIKNQVTIYTILLLIVCIFSSIPAGHYVDFEPINGTFQNFNPVRRLLSGQVPYKEFIDYLGLGHLFLGTFFTFIFGGDYQASLVAFAFISILSTVLLSYIIAKVIFNNKKDAILMTSLFIMLLIIRPTFFQNFISIDSQFANSLSFFSKAGNSARFIRGMILPIFIVLFTIIYNKVNTMKYSTKTKDIIFLFCISSLSAFAFIWSNDYGISTWVTTIILYFVIKIKNSKNIPKTILFTFLQILISFIFVYIYVSILTLGNFGNWLSATFGTGGYQSWYYNSAKSFYIFNLDISFYQTIQILISLYYFYLYLKNKENNIKYLVLGFINMVAFCAINEYKLLSGGNSYEYGTTILFFTLMYELINYLKTNIFKAKYVFGNVLLILVLFIQTSWIIGSIQNELIFTISNKSGEYIAELGGNNTKFRDELISTKDFLEDKKVFSTYSSAIEVMTNQFQPTKYDYIIHTLGDKSRSEYLNAFKEGNFDYAATIHRYYTSWEMGWITRANWYFYRELYNNYHPVYANSYQLFWDKTENPKDNYVTNEDYEINVDFKKVNSNTIIVNVNTDESVNGYADLYIDYQVKKTDRFITNFMFNKMLQVVNNSNSELVKNYDVDSNYLKDESKEYIPVKIIDGKGSLVLTSKPEEGTSLILNNISCEKIFTVVYDYVEINFVEEKNDDIILRMDNNLTNIAATAGVKKIVINDKKISVTRTNNDKSIYLKLKTNMTKEEIENILKTKNNFKIIK